MKITLTKARAKPDGAPSVLNPVSVKLDVLVYYYGNSGPQLVKSPIYCAELYAKTVLTVLNTWATKYCFAIVHVGFYNPRMARHADGTPIKPARWSNHAYGSAGDIKGIIAGDKLFISMPDLKANSPKKYNELMTAINQAIANAGHRPEIIHEGGNPGWTHVGIYK